jgi:non-heme chloroperoxidase
MAFFEADGRRIYFEHYSGAKRPVFLIHGWGMSSQVWASVIDQLCLDGHEVVAVDQRGCGRSDRDFTDLSIAAVAADVDGIARSIDLRPVVLNGWSLGGTVAVEAAARMGDRVAGVVLTCAASPRLTRAGDFPFGADAAAYDGLGAAIAADRAGFFRGLASTICARDIGQPMIDWMTSIFLESAPRAYATLTAAAALDQRATLSGLAVPVLSCVGARDAVIDPELGVAAARCARLGQLARFEHSGHAPFLDEPEHYMAVVREFIGSLV